MRTFKSCLLLFCSLLGSLSALEAEARVRTPAQINVNTVRGAIDYHQELLGNEEYDYDEFAWKLMMAPESKKLPFSKLTPDEAIAIMAYTSNLYQEINRRLRAHEDLKQLKVIVEAMKSGLKKLPAFKGQVYRSTRALPDEELKKHVPGAIIPYEAFTSSSLRTYNDLLFGPNHFLIQSENGKDITPISIHYQNDSEREVLFAPCTFFEVTESNLNQTASRVEMKEVPSNAPCGISNKKSPAGFPAGLFQNLEKSKN